MPADAVLTVASSKPAQKIQEDLLAACARHRFGVLGVIDLRAKMKEKGVDYANDVVVFEVCNPQQAKAALTADARISTVLPCRISLITESGRSRLATVRPRVMLDLFGAKGVEPVAEEVEKTLAAIMKEAAG